MGLSKRKPIYIPFPQAVPQVVLIDPARCLQVQTGKCKKTCLEACAHRHAIDFARKRSWSKSKVGNIIVATGFENFSDAKGFPDTATAFIRAWSLPLNWNGWSTVPALPR